MYRINPLCPSPPRRRSPELVQDGVCTGAGQDVQGESPLPVPILSILSAAPRYMVGGGPVRQDEQDVQGKSALPVPILSILSVAVLCRRFLDQAAGQVFSRLQVEG
jgi:hypothetical protein